MDDFERQWRQTQLIAGTLNGIIMIAGGIAMFAVGIEKGEPFGGLLLGSFFAAGGYLLFRWVRRKR